MIAFFRIINPCILILVLDEIISVLISPQLIQEITKPQVAYSHDMMKDLIEDIVQSSAMRLDMNSMDKLWDLITMVFKWQCSLSPSILKLTSRHLYEIETFVTHEETQLQLHKVQNIFDNYAKILIEKELEELRDAVLDWLDIYHVKVSLLLRLGLQDVKGAFIVDNLNQFAQDMLRNLGENIYSVSQNGKLFEKEKLDNESGKEEDNGEALELQMLAGHLGATTVSSTANVLKLSINQKEAKVKNHFVNAEIQSADNNNVQSFLEELSLNTNQEVNDNNLNEDLIKMIENDNESF